MSIINSKKNNLKLKFNNKTKKNKKINKHLKNKLN